MTDTTTTDDTFASVTSSDVAPGETPSEARKRRKTAKRAATKKAAAPRKAAPRKPATSPPTTPATPASADTTTPRGPGRPSKASKRAENATAMIGLAGTAVFALNQADGLAILNGASDLAAALAEVADANRAVAKVLDATFEIGGWAKVGMAAWAIVGPILVNHGAFGMAPTVPAAAPEPDGFSTATQQPYPPFGGVDPFGGFVAQPDPAPNANGAVVAPGVPAAYRDEPWNMPFRAK